MKNFNSSIVRLLANIKKMSEIKYVAYLRVSTQKQGRSGLGLEAQEEIIKFNVPEKNIINWFCEIESGKNLNNLPILNNAIAIAKKERAVLVIAKTDRLRNTKQALDLVDELTPEGVFFCNVGRNADKFMLTLYFAFAEKERLEISIRTKAALSRLKAKGVKLGIYTHQNTKKNTCPLPNLFKLGAAANKEKALQNKNNIMSANRAIGLKLQGKPLNEIVSILNAEGYKTMANNKWHSPGIIKLLRRHFDVR